LVACPQPPAILTVEILEKEDEVFPVGIARKAFILTKNRPLALLISLKDLHQALREIKGNLVKSRVLAGTGRALDRKIVAVVLLIFL
jgi:hypothetical protein